MGAEAGPAPPKKAVGPVGPQRGPVGPTIPEGATSSQAEGNDPEAALLALGGVKVRQGFMDVFAEQKRQSWDELKDKLSKASLKEAGNPGNNDFDAYSNKLEKERNERLGLQEQDTKKMLK